MASLPDTQLLDAAFLPPAPGLEPAIVLYAPADLSPGAWRRAAEALGVPDTARRLTLPIGDPEQPRLTETRALAVSEAIPFLIELARRELRPSVNAWVLAAHIARRIHEGAMLPRGNEKTDEILARIASGMPASSHAVLVEIAPEGDDPLTLLGPSAEGPAWGAITAQQALGQFLDVAQHAYALGTAQQRTPARRGQSRALAGLALRLELPRGRDGRWLVRIVATSDEVDETRLRTVLREAAGTWTPLERALAAPLGDPLEITVDEASALMLASSDLRATGALVEVPEELALGVERQVRARIRFRDSDDRGAAAAPRAAPRASHAGPRFRLEDLVAYDIDVALGGVDVDADELRRLARQAGALVQLGGEWLALDDAARDQLERLARAVEAQDAHMANSAALAAALGGETVLPGGIRVEVERVDEAALARAVEFLRDPGTFEQVEAPSGFVGELRPYQQKGLTWLAGMASLPLGAVLADDMGLGKTVQVIALLQHIRHQRQAAGQPVGRVLVTCPTSLIGNWQRELARFAPELDVHVHHGPMREARASQLEHDVVVTSYGLVARDRDMLATIDWAMLVFDEAQAVKNPDTELARSVRLLRAPVRVALTGTPMENRLLELWAILDLVNPGLLGTAPAFTRRFATPIERSGDERAAATLRALTRPFMLRRVKHDPEIVPDLPEKQERMLACTLTAEQAALYQATADAALAEVRRRDGIGRRGAVLALLTRLKQICNHPMQALGHSAGEQDPDGETYRIAGRSGKLDRLESMLGEVVAEGDRALVFTQYAQMGHLLAAHLPDVLGCEVPYLHGGVPRIRREELVARFQEEGDDPMVFVLSLKAGGLGLNLMNAAHVFHYDRWWNPAVEDQATDRTHRIGQTRGIQVHKLVCAGTLEERIAQIIDEKRALAGRIIETAGASGEGWITELDDDALAELVALGKDALAEAEGAVPA